jgi:multiple sugar transport system substrate-binding protein
MKKLLSLLCVFVLGFTLAACGSDKDAEGKTTVTFWHTTPMGDPGYKAISQLVNDFNKSQDEVFVKQVGYSFWDYWDKLNIVTAGGNGPDLGLNTIDNSISRAEAGIIYNLQDLIDRDNFDTSKFYQNQIDFGSYDGDIYALPFTATTRVLYYNLDLFEKNGLTEADIPTTWDELHTVAKQIDEVDSKGNIKVLGFDPTAGEATFHGWLWQKGLDFFDENQNPVINSDEHEAVLTWMKEFNKEFSKSDLQGFADANQLLGLDAFTAGRTAMYIASDGLHYTLQQKNVSFDYGVATIPIPEDGVRVNWGSGFSLEMFNNKDAAKKEAAWTFYKYIMSDEVQEKYYDITGWLMSNKDAMAAPAAEDPILAKLVEELPYAIDKVYIPYAPNWHANDWQPFYNQALNRDNDVRDALRDAQNYYIQKRENYDSTH